MDTVRVEVARLRAGGVPLGRLPFSAQVVSMASLPDAGVVTLADALEGLVGVSTASQFGSEVQPDLRLRGFQVGPVVGYPQSVGVFVDGVRVNEPDASQVNFDLIPLHAVERVEVVRSPGGPFGRNSLAGSINLVTRRGTPGAGPAGAVEAGGGSFGTAQAQGWVGGGTGAFDYLASARYYRSDGWRDLNETRLRQLFGKLGARWGAADAWLSYTYADSYVQGPGSLPTSWLRGDLPPELGTVEDPRRLQFTGFQGDWFDPRLHFAVLGARAPVGGGAEAHVTSFVRANRFQQFNDNITEANARGETDILSYGATAQLLRSTASGATWSAGAEFVRNDTDIYIFEEANPAFPDAGGMTESVASVEDAVGLFAHVSSPLSPRASVTASLRYDHVFIPVTDRLDPENSGENRYDQVTGSLGGDFVLSRGLRVFGGYGRGFRAPVVLEISCADPLDPCPLPFELGADPPLDAVTTDSWQGGLRLLGARQSVVELAAYWSEVRDDLFNVVAPPTTRGYFTNLDRTRRRGVELSGRARPLPALELRASAALTRATFESEATLSSALLGDDDDEGGEAGEEEGGGVEVEPGDRFAMVPAVTANAGAELASGGWLLELEGSYVGSQYFVGDEGNDADFGTLDSYALLGGRIERSLGGFAVYLRGENLLDADFNTFGILSPNVRGPDEDAQPFLTPGLPRSLQAGIRYRF